MVTPNTVQLIVERLTPSVLQAELKAAGAGSRCLRAGLLLPEALPGERTHRGSAEHAWCPCPGAQRAWLGFPRYTFFL